MLVRLTVFAIDWPIMNVGMRRFNLGPPTFTQKQFDLLLTGIKLNGR